MEQTLEKEVLEEEKKSQHSIFETELFKEVFKGVKEVEGELRKELKEMLLGGMKDFVKKEITNTEPINEEALELAFFAGIATVLGGDVCGSMRHKEDLKTKAIKRVIRKENLIGFNIEFEGDQEEKGGVIMPKEQYEKLTKEGKTILEIVSIVSPQDKKIKDVCLMDERELDRILDISADKLIRQDFEE